MSSLECRQPFFELNIFDVKSFELFSDVPQESLKTGLGIGRKDKVVISGTSTVFSKACKLKTEI
jgi:hypothetical protein